LFCFEYDEDMPTLMEFVSIDGAKENHNNTDDLNFLDQDSKIEAMQILGDVDRNTADSFT